MPHPTQVRPNNSVKFVYVNDPARKPAPDNNAPLLKHVGKVKWQYQVERDKLSQTAHDSLGSILTIFKPSQEALEEIQRVIESPGPAPQSEIVPIADTEAEDPLSKPK